MCGDRKLASLTENQQARHLLDDEWADGAVNYCLGQGQWRFATRTVEMAASPSVEPDFGYQNAFPIPDDFIRTVALCSDSYFKVPLLAYVQEQSYWFADIDPLYLSYVSNDASYGGDMSLWPNEFVLYLQAYLASKIVETLTQDKSQWEKLFKLARRYLIDARSSNAMEGPTVFPPSGSWSSARRGRAINRGSRNRLIG
jgi:hypothetical protein